MTGKRLEDVREELEQEAVQRIAELEAEVERIGPLEAALSQARRNVWEMEAEVERLREMSDSQEDGARRLRGVVERLREALGKIEQGTLNPIRAIARAALDSTTEEDST